MTKFSFQTATSRTACVPARARRGWMVLMLAGLSPLAGCYVNRPVTTAPAPGTTLLLDLTDRGRVALGDRVGQAAATIEGVLQSPGDSVYELRVSSVTYLNGQHNRWTGELLAVPLSLVSRARSREFSRSRTTAVGVGIAAAIVAVFANTNFLGGGGVEKVPPPPPTGGT